MVNANFNLDSRSTGFDGHGRLGHSVERDIDI